MDIVRIDATFDPEPLPQGRQGGLRNHRHRLRRGQPQDPEGPAGPRSLRRLHQRHHRSREPRRADRPEFRWHQVSRSGRGRAEGRHGAAHRQVRERADLGHARQGRRGDFGRSQAHPEVTDIWTFAREVGLAQSELEAGRHPSRKLANLAAQRAGAGFLTGEIRFGSGRCISARRCGCGSWRDIGGAWAWRRGQFQVKDPGWKARIFKSKATAATSYQPIAFADVRAGHRTITSPPSRRSSNPASASSPMAASFCR